jgi:hypothetical protein
MLNSAYFFMNNLIYLIAFLLTIFWVTGYFPLNRGVVTKVLFVIAFAGILVNMIKRKKPLQ